MLKSTAQQFCSRQLLEVRKKLPPRVIDMPIFVIYQKPRDLPYANFVVRIQFPMSIELDSRELHTRPCDELSKEIEVYLLPWVFMADTLEDARAVIPEGQFIRMDRTPGDDPVIVETWF